MTDVEIEGHADEVASMECWYGVEDLVIQWELADRRDAWRHTGEPRPPQQAAEPIVRRSYRTPQSTISAFWCVVRLDDAGYLSRWLARHPMDAPELHKLWERKAC